MIEGFSREMPEDLMVEAIMESHKVICGLCELQLELQKKAGTKKAEFEAPEPDGLLEQLTEKYYDQFKAVKQTEGKQARADAVAQLKEQATAELIPDPDAADAIARRPLVPPGTTLRPA